MAALYRVVQWNPQKRRYDLLMALAVMLYLGSFVAVSSWRNPEATPETVALRALGSCAIVLLHCILIIGPLARLDVRWLPLLYNRRHLGVLFAGVATAHGVLALLQFHAGGDLSPLVSLLSTPGIGMDPRAFPFQPLGAAAWVIFVAMAASSHDFWLHHLGARSWKLLHMGVYFAWLLVLAHVALGPGLVERSGMMEGALVTGAVLVVGSHLLAAFVQSRRDRAAVADGDWVDAGPVDSFVEGWGAVVPTEGESIAIFAHQGMLRALSNVCAHQLGPLGEGRILDGCVTCPWHGYQYRPEDGRAPAPYEDRLVTYPTRIREGRVQVQTRPSAPGEASESACMTRGEA